MEIVNAVLLMCALILVWGAINLERPGAQRVELNQSDQLNDSINFLKKLKKPSAKEQSQDRRAQAFKSHVDSVSEEIPSTMDSIEESFEQIQYGQRRKVKQLQQLVTDIHTQLETSNQLQSTTTTHPWKVWSSSRNKSQHCLKLFHNSRITSNTIRLCSKNSIETPKW